LIEPPPSRAVASAPGKLILAGEHAVVYGRPALVAAVDLRLTATFAAAPDGAVDGAAAVHLTVPPLGLAAAFTWGDVVAYAREARGRWLAYAASPGAAAFAAVRGDDPAHLVKVALGEAAAHLGEEGGPPLDLVVDAELPVGAGFGSSAAAAVALVAGYLALRGAPPADLTPAPRPALPDALPAAGAATPASPAPLPAPAAAAAIPDSPAPLAIVERLALEVERRQHGLPSGVDGSTVLHGGVRWAERDAAGRLATRPFAAHPRLLARFQVFHTGAPAEPTGAVVAAVRERLAAGGRRLEAALDAIAAATAALRDRLAGPDDDPAALCAPVAACHRALSTLGVVPEAVREVVGRIEAAGGAAKISGAGSLAGPGAGSLLVVHPDPGRVASWPFLAPYRRYPVVLGAPGLRVAAAGDRGAR
jgi:mevalonate kinase